MANYDLTINSQFTESGDDVYGKPDDSTFATADWPDDSVAATEIALQNVYTITLDETKGYLFYLNVAEKAFTADAGTNFVTSTAHGLLNGERVRFKGADLPAPLVQSTLYYVINKTDNTFQVSATSGGAAIDLTDAGTGTMVFNSPSLRTGGVDAVDPDLLIGTVAKVRESASTGEAELAAILALIKAKTDLIGTGSAQLQSPMSVDGQIASPLIIGDDYLASNDRSLNWTVDLPTDMTIAGTTCKLGFRLLSSCTEFSIVFDGTITDAGAGNVVMNFDMLKVDTATIIEGEYYASAELIGDAGEEVTKFYSRKPVKWKAKAT